MTQPSVDLWFSRPGPWSMKTRLLVLAVLLAAFVTFYLVVAPSAGGRAGAPAGLFVLAAGYLLGLAAGLVAGLLMMPLIWSMYPLVGANLGASGLPSMLIFVALMASMGAAAGWVGLMQMRSEQAQKQAARLRMELEHAQESAGLGYWSLHRNGRISWSQELIRVFGFAEPPPDMQSIYARLHPDDRAQAESNIAELWKGGGPFEGEQRAVWPDGSVHWLQYTSTVEKDANGNVIRIFGTTQDITDRKRHEAADKRFRDLLDRLDDVYWVGDPADDRFEYSRAAVDLFGYPVEELSVDPSKMARGIHPEDMEGVASSLSQVVEHKPATSEFRLIRPDGSIRYVHSQAWPIQDDSMFTAHGIMRDVTAEKELEKSRSTRLREADDFQRLLDNLDDVYFTNDLQGGNLRVSTATHQVYGRSPQEFEDDPDLWQKVVLDEDQAITEQSFQEVMQGKQVETTVRIKHTDGSVRTVRTTVWPRIDDGQVVGAVGVVRDISSEEELVRLKELDEMKALFMNAASHELNTPLTPLKLQVALLQQKLPGDRGVKILERNVGRMEALVKDLLDASRMQAGRLKFVIQDDADVSGILMDVSHGGELEAKGSAKQWITDIESGLRARCDPLRLTQVFNNLIRNALKFTPEGGHITLRARDDGDRITVQVEDDGLGIDSQDLDGLFQPFHQFHHQETGAHKGTGLGLFISQGIVEHHGGRIQAESEGRGEGATFTVTLPKQGDAKNTTPEDIPDSDQEE